MRQTAVTLTLCVAFLAGLATAQTGEWSMSAAARGLFVTSSKIYPNPNNPSFDLRIINTPFAGVTGYGGELRIQRFGTNYFFYVSAEILSEVRSEQKLDGSITPPRRVPVDEGYRMIPIELGGHVYVPIGSQSWRLSMGGGIGAYHTERIYSIAGVSAQPVGNRFGFGIHVSISTEYLILPRLSIVAGIKFRDPEVDVRNKFDVVTTMYNNGIISLPQGEFPSRINVDGMTLSAGVRFEVF